MSLVEKLGKHFLSSDYCHCALTHRSAGAKNNERLEYLGDSLLGFFIAEWLFNAYPTFSEGELTRLRAHFVKRDTLAEIAREQNLGDHLILGSGELKSGGLHRDSILADALEALIGALYLSEGLEQTRAFVVNLYKTRLQSIPAIDQLKDAKTRLQEVLQSEGVALPTYVLKKKSGNNLGDQVFTVVCIIENCSRQFAGMGKNRRRAEQDAAARALTYVLNKNVKHA